MRNRLLLKKNAVIQITTWSKLTEGNIKSYLLIDVGVAGVDAVSEKVLCAAVTAAQVAVVEQLPARTNR